MAPINFLKKQLWNARRFGFTPDKIYARLTSSVMSKIICISVPKSGTHLLERALCLHPPLYRPLLPTLTPKNVEKRCGIRRILEDLCPGQLIFCHFSYRDDMADAIRANGIKSLFLIRDPRDVAVSEVFYVTSKPNHRLHHLYTSQKDFRQQLLTAIQGAPEDYGPYASSIGTRLDAFSGWFDSEALVVRFENLIGPNGGGDAIRQRDELSRIFQFVGVDLTEDQLTRIGEQLYSNASPTFRKGSIGDWRNYFDPEQKQVFKKVANEQLIRYGYEDNPDW